MLPNWFERYGAHPASATERGFEFDYDGATIVGYIDRIGPDPAGSPGTRITDYKTGNPDRAPKANESLQLGIYYLAVLESEELEEFQPVSGVELSYLKGHWRTGELETQGVDGRHDRSRRGVSERDAGEALRPRRRARTTQ